MMHLEKWRAITLFNKRSRLGASLTYPIGDSQYFRYYVGVPNIHFSDDLDFCRHLCCISKTGLSNGR